VKPAPENTTIMPTHIDAERMVLGLLLLAPETAYTFGTCLDASHFALDSHRRLYRALQSLVEAGKPVSYLTLEDQLKTKNELDLVGGYDYISGLTELMSARGVDPEYYARLVKEKSLLRDTINTCMAAEVQAGEPGANPDEVVGQLQDRLSEILSGTARRLHQDSETTMHSLVEMLGVFERHNGDLLGLTTGIRGLDRSTTGIRSGELWVIGARPGQGKTSLARQVARANAKQNIPVLFYSLEMGAEWIRAADLAAESAVRFSKIRNAFYTREEKQRIADTCAEMAKWPLYIVDEGGLDIRQIVAHSMMMIRQHGIKLVIVDHLQIVGDHEHRERLQQVAHISNRLRVLAKSTGVPVLLLSQLTRPKDGDSRPKLFQLKESGDVEAHSHTVVMPYLPQEDTGDFSHRDELIVAKQRFGEIGPLSVLFRKDSLDFVERENGR
jgi:replicative DNA helicase